MWGRECETEIAGGTHGAAEERRVCGRHVMKNLKSEMRVTTSACLNRILSDLQSVKLGEAGVDTRLSPVSDERNQWPTSYSLSIHVPHLKTHLKALSLSPLFRIAC